MKAIQDKRVPDLSIRAQKDLSTTKLYHELAISPVIAFSGEHNGFKAFRWHADS